MPSEREREEERKQNAQRTHTSHTTNNVHATLYPKYTNVYPTLLLFACMLPRRGGPCYDTIQFHPNHRPSTCPRSFPLPPSPFPLPPTHPTLLGGYLAPYFLPPKTPFARPSKAPTISSTIPPATRPTATPSAALANRYRIVRVISDHPSSRPGAGDTVHRVTRLSKIPVVPAVPVAVGEGEGAGYPHASSVGTGIVVVAAPETASTIPPPGEGIEYTSEV